MHTLKKIVESGKGYFLLMALLLIGCSSENDFHQTQLKGEITVADSIDDSGNYHGIELLVFKRDSANADADTLFWAETDTSGHFSGTAVFDSDGFYPIQVTRNNRVLGRNQLILADKDTLQLTAQLPAFSRTLQLESYQHEALSTFKRLNRQFRNIGAYVRAGEVSSDSIPSLMKKWSGIYWEVYGKYEDTFAGRMSAVKSLDISRGMDYNESRRKITRLAADEKARGIAIEYGKELISREKGLEAAIQFLDSLSQVSTDEPQKRQISRAKVNLLYDSSRVEAARNELENFKQNFANTKEVKNWAEHIMYDLEHLAPGDSLPGFSLKTNEGAVLDRNSMEGNPYILEISPLANNLYKEQYSRSQVIYNLFQTRGLRLLTVPLDSSQITVDTFFEARGGKQWKVASVASVNKQQIIETFNIKNTPTRFMVDSEGKIVKKLVGNEYEDIIPYIQQTLTPKEENL